MHTDSEERPAEIIVPREKAVFWMDERGRWHNQHGVFKHKKIIAHFNAAIKRDEGGYFVGQYHDEVYEKVYFPYQETALFVVDLVWGDSVQMVLNTGEKFELAPEMLFVRNDHLFHSKGDEIIKFSERVLTAISQRLEYGQGAYVIEVMGKKYSLTER